MTQTPIVTTDAPKMTTSGYLAIVIGLLATSLAAIFIRNAQNAEVPSLFIAGGRLTVAALILTPFTWHRYRSELRTLQREDLLLALLSGTVLAVHFATWISSLEYTSVLISVVLVGTSPLWVALLELVFLRSALRPLVIAGLLLALVGGMMIGVGGSSGMGPGTNPLLGGVLALVGAVAVAVYFVIGRRLRAKLSLLPYIWMVYGCAAVILMLTVGATRTPVTGYSFEGYLWIVALALVPQLIGHSALNYALKYLSATYISIITQTEPIASAIVAFIAFREMPLPLQIAGSLMIIIGVVFASLGQQGAPAETVEAAAD